MSVAESIQKIAESWRATVETPRRRLLSSATALVVVTALLVARHGTPWMRVAAASAMVAVVLGIWALRLVDRRTWRDPARAIRRLAGKVDREKSSRALRALTLVEASGAPRDAGTSTELARLHIDRAIAALPRDRIDVGATALAFKLGAAAVVGAAVVLVVAATNAWAVVEGADVLVAHDGVAPVGMRWLDDLEVRARPPEYLHEDEQRVVPPVESAFPRGTLLTFRGTPVHVGRRLALWDGSSEVPLVDDGSGGVIARWPLADSVALRVVARFGDVVIEEPFAARVTSIADLAPEVKLEGAPRKISLATAEDGGDVPIRYEATDDHGLREVHLVLRSGARDERRVLARLDGETRLDRGGYVLRARDPFLRKSHAPIEVRVEAKDNDPITGPKWGASAPITILPPEVGEPEALRLDALRRLRNAFVDALAVRIEKDAIPADAARLRAFVAAELAGVDENRDLLEATLTAAYAGVKVNGRLAAMLRGQMRRVREAMDKEARGPATSATHASLVKATERLVLVTDAIVHGLGQKDTRDVARQLADVAEDLALGAGQAQRPEVSSPSVASAARSVQDHERGVLRMDAAVLVLEGGARSMMRLGALGRDIGEIVTADLLRVDRARRDSDLPHAELAARDLAARLHEPDPSFGSRGSSGRGGGESGGGRGTPGDDDEPSDDAERAFNEAAHELGRLAADHNQAIGKVEQALNSAGSDDELHQLTDEAKKHAEAVREAASRLPTISAGSDSWTSKGAAAREHAEGMARSLEQGNPADALASGRSALGALDEARRIAGRERWLGQGSAGESEVDKRIREARQRLEPEVRWAEQKLEALRKRASERAANELSAHGDEEEKMAERARDLAGQGRDQRALPAPALESLEAAEHAARDAARALKQGDADKGLEHQRDAQRHLDMAQESMGTAEGDRGGGTGDSPSGTDHADIPNAESHKGPEEFRRRVVEGLGQPSSGRLKDAVRRYAEGLLR